MAGIRAFGEHEVIMSRSPRPERDLFVLALRHKHKPVRLQKCFHAYPPIEIRSLTFAVPGMRAFLHQLCVGIPATFEASAARTRCHHHDAIGENNCVICVIGHEQNGLTRLLPDPQDSRCIPSRVSVSSAPNGLSINSSAGLPRVRAGNRRFVHPLTFEKLLHGCDQAIWVVTH
jgi:hypothetical protein